MVKIYGLEIKWNRIGPVPVEDALGNSFITEFMIRDNEVTLGGIADNINTIYALKELCRFAPGNVVVRRVIGGEEMAIDLTEDQRNIVFCTFTTDRLLSGFYLLMGFEYSPRSGYVTSYPFRLRMYFLGTDIFYLRAFFRWAKSLTNDWGI